MIIHKTHPPANKKILKYRDPISYGRLKYDKSLMFSEAEQIIKPKAHNDKIQAILREAMDKTGEITKGVTSRIIKYKTNTSFLMASYHLKEQTISILDTGFIQRCLFYYKTLNDSEHYEICDYQKESIFNPINNKLVSNNFYGYNH